MWVLVWMPCSFLANLMGQSPHADVCTIQLIEGHMVTWIQDHLFGKMGSADTNYHNTLWLACAAKKSKKKSISMGASRPLSTCMQWRLDNLVGQVDSANSSLQRPGLCTCWRTHLSEHLIESPVVHESKFCSRDKEIARVSIEKY